MDGDAGQRPNVKAKKAPSAPSLDEWNGHVAAGHAEYRGWCPLCVAGKRIEASRDHGHLELHLDHAYVGRERQRTEHRHFWLASSRRIVG